MGMPGTAQASIAAQSDGAKVDTLALLTAIDYGESNVPNGPHEDVTQQVSPQRSAPSPPTDTKTSLALALIFHVAASECAVTNNLDRTRAPCSCATSALIKK